MTIDRPFMFVIRDIETGVALFVGRAVDPDRLAGGRIPKPGQNSLSD